MLYRIKILLWKNRKNPLFYAILFIVFCLILLLLNLIFEFYTTTESGSKDLRTRKVEHYFFKKLFRTVYYAYNKDGSIAWKRVTDSKGNVIFDKQYKIIDNSDIYNSDWIDVPEESTDIVEKARENAPESIKGKLELWDELIKRGKEKK